MTVDWGNISNFLVVAQFAITAAGVVLLLWLGTKFPSRKEFGELGSNVATLAARVDTIEDRLTKGDSQFAWLDKHLEAIPTRDDLADIRIALEKLSGQQNVVQTQVSGFAELFRLLDRQVRTMDEYLRQTTK